MPTFEEQKKKREEVRKELKPMPVPSERLGIRRFGEQDVMLRQQEQALNPNVSIAGPVPIVTGAQKRAALGEYARTVGDAPERILLSTIQLSNNWKEWKPTKPIEILRPEMQWEGVYLEPKPSFRGAIIGPVCQLRDPAIYEEEHKIFLLYAVAGESGIAIAELEFK